MYAVLGCSIQSSAQVRSKRTDYVELDRKLAISKLDGQHFSKYNNPVSPKEQILRHRHKHDENGSRTSDSSFSRSEFDSSKEGYKLDPTSKPSKSPTPLRPGFALRGIDPPEPEEDIKGAVLKEENQLVEPVEIKSEEYKEEENAITEVESVVEAFGDSMSNIFDVANERKELSDFVKVTEAANFAETLIKGESLTVFAPTNNAFAKQPDEFLQRYLNGNWNRHLEDLVLSHVANGRVQSDDLTSEMQVELLNQDTLLVTLDPPSIDEDIKITSFDIAGSNGIIHEIDSVRLPLSAKLNTIEYLQLATMLEDIPYSFSLFLEYLELTNLSDAIASASPITLFVPTDTAIKNSSEDAFISYLEKNLNSLGKVLAYHATSGNMYSDILKGEIETYEGKRLTFGSGQNGIEIVSASGEIKAKIVDSDVLASNGVIHIIDSLLVPSEVVNTFNL